MSRTLVLFLLWLSFSMVGLVPAAGADALHLWHTAGVDGLASSYRYQLGTPYRLLLDYQRSQPAPDQARVEVVRTEGVFYSQGHYFWGQGADLSALQTFLQQAPEPLSRMPVGILNSGETLLILPGDRALTHALARFADGHGSYRERLQLQEGELLRYADGLVLLRLRAASAELPRDPLQWEMLLRLDVALTPAAGTAQTAVVLGQPLGEGARRVQTLQSLRGPHDLLVDSGNLLEGLSSVRTNQLSSQRVNSLAMAQALRYDALNVGSNELRGGVAHLQQEQARHALPLVSASLRENKQFAFAPYRLLESQGRRLAVLGLGDTARWQHLQEQGVLGAEYEILKPEQALEAALEALSAEAPVDEVVLLSELPEAELRGLLLWRPELQLVLTPGPTVNLQHQRASLELSPLAQTQPFGASTHPQAVSLVRLDTTPERRRFVQEQLPIDFQSEPAPAFVAPIQRVRQAAYANAFEILIPNLAPAIQQDKALTSLYLASPSLKAAAERRGLRDDAAILAQFPPYLTRELLQNLMLNGLLESFDAEVAVLRQDESAELALPGALPKLLVYEQFKQGDRLERFQLNGSQLKALLALPQPLVFGGVSADRTQVWGRPLGDQRVYYRVLLPTGVSSLAAVRPILAGAPREERLDTPLDASAAPVEVYLRDTFIQLLERLRRQPNYSAELLRLLHPQGAGKRGLLTLQLDGLQLNLSGYNAINNSAYAEVRETRVSSPSSLSFGGRSRLALGWDDPLVGWVNAVQAKYEALSVLDPTSSTERLSENQDDLVFSSELRLNLLEFPLFDTRLPLIPFVEGLYDTEFTPTLNATTNANNPLQSELRSVLGLSVPPGEQLRSLKAGLALRRDFNVPDNLEAGLDLKLVHEQPLNPQLLWTNNLDMRYFLPGSNDNASSLALTAQWVTALKVALTDNLSLRIYADSYVFQGKLPATSQPGASVILGIGLGYDRIWKPFWAL